MVRREAGFTLIEILLVIGILVLLLSIVIVAINPARQFANANNAKRSSDVNAILNAIQQYMVDNRGSLPPNMATGSATVTIATGVGNADICSSLVPRYIAAFPSDPNSTAGGSPITNCNSYNSGYVASMSATDNRITISAPNAQLGITVGTTR